MATGDHGDLTFNHPPLHFTFIHPLIKIDIYEIQSHPAILEQCQDFLDATLKEGYRAVLASNTASAAEQVAQSDEFGM